MTFEHRTYNTAPIATVASAVRALVVKINNTTACIGKRKKSSQIIGARKKSMTAISIQIDGGR